MSHPGRQPDPRRGQQDDWWSQLYAPDALDTGRTRAGDTLDDRFAEIRRTVGPRPGPPGTPSRGAAEDGAGTGGTDGTAEPDGPARPETAPAPQRAEGPGAGEEGPEASDAHEAAGADPAFAPDPATELDAATPPPAPGPAGPDAAPAEAAPRAPEPAPAAEPAPPAEPEAEPYPEPGPEAARRAEPGAGPEPDAGAGARDWWSIGPLAASDAGGTTAPPAPSGAGTTGGDVREPSAGWWFSGARQDEPAAPEPGGPGDTLDDRFASIRRAVGPTTASDLDPAAPAEPPAPADGDDTAPASPEEQPPPPEPSAAPEPAPAEERPPADAPPAPPAPPSPYAWGPAAPVPSPETQPPDPAAARPPQPAPEAYGTPARGTAWGPAPSAGRAVERARRPDHVGDRPPTYDAEPAALPEADPAALAELVPDTVLDGARYGGFTLRAASLRGDSARHRGALRRDALLTARFGTGASALLLVAVAAGGRVATGGHRAAREMCQAIGGAVGRSHTRLAEDVRAGRRDALKPGLQRLTERCYGRLRAQAAALGVPPEEYTADLCCLLLPADPGCRSRVFFGAGGGGLFRLRRGAWRDVEEERREPPAAQPPAAGAPPVPPARPEPAPFRFHTAVARPGDVLLLSSPGLAAPLRAEPAFADRLAQRWSDRRDAPGLAAFLSDVQLRVRGYADDRTAVAVWED